MKTRDLKNALQTDCPRNKWSASRLPMNYNTTVDRCTVHTMVAHVARLAQRQPLKCTIACEMNGLTMKKMTNYRRKPWSRSLTFKFLNVFFFQLLFSHKIIESYFLKMIDLRNKEKYVLICIHRSFFYKQITLEYQMSIIDPQLEYLLLIESITELYLVIQSLKKILYYWYATFVRGH